ncbi:MAG: TetR family transcriptional regulator [Methyloligellaceae bacterium]
MTEETRNDQPKWRRRAEARPDEVLDAALDLFIAHGFAATRVEDIAARAGLSKGAVYLYFDSKEAILEALVRRSIVPVAKNAAAMAQSAAGNPRDVIRNLVTLVAGRMSNPRLSAIPRLIIAEAGNFPRLAKMYREEVLDRALTALETLIRAGVEQGVFRPVDPRLAVRNVVGPILAHSLLAGVFGITEGDDADPRRFVDSHLDILLNGLAAEREEK